MYMYNTLTILHVCTMYVYIDSDSFLIFVATPKIYIEVAIRKKLTKISKATLVAPQSIVHVHV